MSEINKTPSTGGSGADSLSQLQRAALVIKDLKEKLAREKASSTEPIAVVGMSCKFPHADNLNEFWDLLVNGRNAVDEVPKERWDLEQWFDPNPATEGKISTRFGGFIKNVDAFDATFFGIPVNEAKRMDPGQRIMLQQVWLALEHAGIPPLSLKGSDTGFFVGMSQNDYGNMQINGDVNEISAYSGTGNGYCFASGRVSYQFGFHGPTLTSDTACSSSLVALHQAVQALRQGDSTVAIASGVQLNLTPPMQVFFSRTQSFSPDGKCYTFDHRANGFILGEGIGVVVLMKLKDAIAQRKTIHAVIKNTGINHGGAASGLTIPNETAQEQLIRQTIKKTGIDPDTIDFIETHGTGTNLGDPIEVGALKSVFGKRPDDRPLYLGSVKTNIGHLNAAAGMAGLIKTILMLKHQQIVPNLNFEKPNAKIPWDGFNAVVPVKLMAWKSGSSTPRRAGVSSFGLSGTNGHVILEEHTAQNSGSDQVTSNGLLGEISNVFTFSAKDEAALNRLLKSHLGFLKSNGDTVNPGQYSFTLNSGRSALEHRIWIQASTIQDLTRLLQVHLDGDADGAIQSAVVSRRDSKRTLSLENPTIEGVREWFLSGGNIQWTELYRAADQKIIEVQGYVFSDNRFWLDESKSSSVQHKSESKAVSNEASNVSVHTKIEASAEPKPQQTGTQSVSVARILEMQIQMATGLLNEVSRQQLASLGRADVQTSVQIAKTEVKTAQNGQHTPSEPTKSAESPTKSSFLHCGDWSLYLKSLSSDESLEEAKSSAIKQFEAGNPSLSDELPEAGSKVMALAYSGPEDAILALKDEKGKRILHAELSTDDTSLVFMFPGVGDHYPGMARGLYESDAAFRSDIDYCLSKASGFLGEPELKSVLYPVVDPQSPAAEAPKFDFKAMLGRDTKADPNQEKLNTTRFSQTLVFILEYALGRLWMRRGFVPNAMIGYSIGEYTAAVLSEIMDIDSALELVCKRALLIEKLPGGSMLAIPLNESDTKKWLDGTNLHIAINSTPGQTVVAGNESDIDALSEKLISKEIMCRKIPSTHAFHTPFLSSIDADLRELVSKFNLKAPKIKLLSNVTGTWMTSENAKNPAYWAQHTWKTVRFAQGLGELLNPTALGSTKRRVFLEVGPGVSLGSFMLQHPDAKQLPFKMNVPSVKSRYEKSPDEQVFLATSAKLLLAGCRTFNHKPSTIL